MSTGGNSYTGGQSFVERLTARVAGQRDLRAVLNGAAQVLAIRLAGAGLAYASMIFLARWLGAFQFGIYAYVWVWIVVVSLAVSLGYASSALRFLPDYLAREKWERLQGFLNQSYAVVLTASTLGAALGAGLLVALRDYVEPYYFAPMLAGLACLPVWAMLNQFEATSRAFGWVHLAFLPGYILRPILIMATVGGVYWMNETPSALVALWAVVAACAVAALVQGTLAIAAVRRRVPAVKPTYHARHWSTISLSFVMIDGFRMLLENSDVMLVGKLLDPDEVAIYFAAARTGGLIAFLYFAVVAMAVPKISKIRATGTREELQHFVSGVTKLMFWPSLAAAAGIACLGPFALSLFGDDFGSGYGVLLVILAGLVIRSAMGPVEYLLTMTGHHVDTMYAYGVAAVANVAMTLILVPMMGIVGAAISSAVALLGVSIWLSLVIYRRLNITAFVFLPRR